MIPFHSTMTTTTTTTMKSPETELQELLSLQIYLDGGSTYVTTFGYLDHYHSIDRLLKQCQHPNQKLLVFLENHPNFFLVSDRFNPQHIVTLQKLGTECAEQWLHRQEEEQSKKEQSSSKAVLQLQSVASKLEERVGYVLRQRISKIIRRARQRQQDHDGGSGHQYTVNDVDINIEPAPVTWAIQKCSNQIHQYTRLLSTRPVGILPQSDEWASAIIPSFMTFLSEERPSKLFVISFKSREEKEKGLSGEDGNRIDPPVVMVDLNSEEKTQIIHSLCTRNGTDGVKSDTTCMVDVEAVSIRIMILLRDHHAPLGGVQLGRLLTDSKLRTLLGGIDLTVLIPDNPLLFKPFSLFHDELRSQWFIILKACDSVREGAMNDAPNDTSMLVQEKRVGSSRLVADEVGTFSLTNPTIALAMAKVICNVLLGNSRRHPNKDTLPSRYEPTSLPDTTVAIDITSGVGGNTLALAKVFPNVIGYEIDKSRFLLLKQNVEDTLGPMSTRVTLECCDSIGALSHLSERFRGTTELQPLLGVIVDPPWGGIDYRRNCTNEALQLGDDMPLSQVVSLVAQHLAPVVLGMKLPLSFQLTPFFKRVRSLPYFYSNQHGTDDLLRVATIKKMGKQLFVVVELK